MTPPLFETKSLFNPFVFETKMLIYQTFCLAPFWALVTQIRASSRERESGLGERFMTSDPGPGAWVRGLVSVSAPDANLGPVTQGENINLIGLSNIFHTMFSLHEY